MAKVIDLIWWATEVAVVLTDDDNKCIVMIILRCDYKFHNGVWRVHIMSCLCMPWRVSWSLESPGHGVAGRDDESSPIPEK